LMSAFWKISGQLVCSTFLESDSNRTHLHWFLSQRSCGFPWNFLYRSFPACTFSWTRVHEARPKQALSLPELLPEWARLQLHCCFTL
jgi:hypothetical protein